MGKVTVLLPNLCLKRSCVVFMSIYTPNSFIESLIYTGYKAISQKIRHCNKMAALLVVSRNIAFVLFVPTAKLCLVHKCVVGRDNSPISSRHPARQQPLDPTVSPPCRSQERRADWPRRQADRPHPWGATSATGK